MADQVLQDAKKNRADPSLANPKLAALNLGRELMNGENPTTAIISDEFCLGQALMVSIDKLFQVEGENNEGLQSVLKVFSKFEEHSPSIGGTGRQQIVELVVSSSRPVYQGMSPLAEPEKPGAFSRLIGMFTRSRGSAQQ